MSKIKQPFIPSARQVRAIRAWTDISQPEFAKRCSISHSALSSFELGRHKTSQEILLAIANYISTLRFAVVDGALVLPE